MKRGSYRQASGNEVRRSRKGYLPGSHEEKEYLFHHSDDNDVGIPLQSKKEESFAEKELQPGETLQSLSLDFNCSIAELKRINKIHKDNEIFALRIVKIPITTGSFIIEKLQNGSTKQLENIKDNLKTNASSLVVEEADITDLCLKISSISSSSDSNEEAKLNILDHNQLVGTSQDHLNHSASCILKSNIHSSQLSDVSDIDELASDDVLEVQSSPSVLQYNGADCGLSWKQLVILILLLCFAGPLIYIFYIAEKMEKHRSKSS